MKLELTIKTDYLQTWGVWEGIRELVQNGRDAEVEFNAPLTVDFFNGTLRIENDGCTLPKEALLLGHSSKSGRSDLIGKFGEGLKLGLLALVRAGMPVKIRSGNEVWVPRIERSEKFNADVLTVQIQAGREPKNRVRVEVGDGHLDREIWDNLRDRFLFLQRPKKSVKTYYGTLLMSEEMQGRIYVKGIFVQKKSGLAFGYDLVDAELDRDRKMVEHYDLQYRLANIFNAAMADEDAKLDKKAYALLKEETKDVEGFALGYTVSPSMAESVVASFRAEYGQDAVPVSNLEESKELEHLGKKGIVVPKPLGAVLSASIGTLEQVKEKLREEVKTRYSYPDLTLVERSSLEDAVALMAQIGEEVSLGIVDVVDFRSDNLLGQFKDKRVLLAKKILSNRDETLATLVHEVAHRAGGDGEKGHVANIERIWSTIVSQLRRR